MLAQGYARNGQTDEARKLLAQLNEMAKSAEFPSTPFALIYTSLGDKDHAIAALEHGFAGGNKSYLFLLPEILCSTIFAAIALRGGGNKKWSHRNQKQNSEDRHLLHRAEAGATFTGRDCLHRRRLGTFAGIAQVFPVFDVPSSRGDFAPLCCSSSWPARCVGLGMDVRADTGGN